MSDNNQRPWERISGIDLAEIEILILIKEVSPEQLQRVLNVKGVAALEQLDWLSIRNFLHYLRSL